MPSPFAPSIANLQKNIPEKSFFYFLTLKHQREMKFQKEEHWEGLSAGQCACPAAGTNGLYGKSMEVLKGKEGTERNSHCWEHLATWARGALRALPRQPRLFLSPPSLEIPPWPWETVITVRPFPWNTSPLWKHWIKTFPSHSNFNLH